MPARPPALAAVATGSDRADADRRNSSNASGTSPALPAQRLPVRMRRLRGAVGRALMGAIGGRSRVRRRVAEDVVEAAKPGAQTLGGRLEHMFVRVERGSDGTAQAADPNVDQTSSLVPTRSITASVNSVVLACPPRSGVFVPAPTVSSAAS